MLAIPCISSIPKTVKLFNVNDGAVVRTFTHHTWVHSLALLPDGRRFVSGSYDTTARVVEIAFDSTVAELTI